MIQVSGLVKHITDGHSNKNILDKLDFTLEAKQSVAISGESGSGKSTLLHILAALDNADKGEVKVAGLALNTMSEMQADKFRKKHLGIVFQQFNLIDCLSVWDNITFPARLNGLPIDQYHSDLLKQLGLSSHKNKMPANLSGGEQQRVAIARSLSHKPSLVLADEPTGNLDDNNSQRVTELLFGLCKTLGLTLVVVTHSQKVAAFADTRLVLERGQLQAVLNQSTEQVTNQNTSKPQNNVSI
ncbi:MAG: putative ABC transport system ATP-binding protein [Paraglaciecola sp.]|jgi:putative ABC transport system ATP-binding protein|uniref:ABC transporter ATP-binding protein n=1 Tax=uncultured Paraglaciecola sp. TaxID=1765024 RepID=UPI0025EFE2BC|nr:ABC transporter ATP-binding protein [uncultured Paraglaciecola sp.]